MNGTGLSVGVHSAVESGRWAPGVWDRSLGSVDLLETHSLLALVEKRRRVQLELKRRGMICSLEEGCCLK